MTEVLFNFRYKSYKISPLIKMNLNSDFSIPMGFINQKRKQLNLNEGNLGLLNCFANNFNYDLKDTAEDTQKAIKSRYRGYKNHKNQSKKQKPDYDRQNSQTKRLKSLLRTQNLNEFKIANKMKKIQKKEQQRREKKIRKIMDKNKIYTGPVDTRDLDLIDLDSSQNEKEKHTLNYVNVTRIRNFQESQRECVQVESLDNPKSRFVFESRKTMYELNKPLHQKNTYRFNVMWWQDQMRQNMPNSTANTQKQKQSQTLNDEARKNLKIQLKPLRKHRLIGNKYAPLSQFATVGTLQKDGKMMGNDVDSSESQEQKQMLQIYDKQADKDSENQYIDLQKSIRSISDKKYDIDGPQSQKKTIFGMKARTEPMNSEPAIQNRLKRALNKMKDHDWKQDELFTKGMNQKPIDLEHLN